MKRQLLLSNTNYTARMVSGLVLGIIFSLLLFKPFNGFSNNLVVSSVTYDVNAGTVTFDLSWQNSWRGPGFNPMSGANNWDAAWVFVKFRDCAANSAVQFTHGLVSTVYSQHSFGSYEATDRFGTAQVIDATTNPNTLTPNNTGVMLRWGSNITGQQATNSGTVIMKLTNLNGTTLPSGTADLRVFAIEMVYVNQGPFSLGDGGWNNTPSNVSSTGSFCIGVTGTTPGTVPFRFPINISAESVQTVYDVSAICPSNACNLTANFPKGYNAFYMMKYEISQGQYVDFINTLPPSAQNAHYPQRTGLNRHTVFKSGTTFNTIFSTCTTSRDDRACNWLAWYDVTAYLDWAALRPLSEMEYEKACRGPLQPVLYEKAWGSSINNPPSTFTAPAVGGISTNPENGQETITTGFANMNAGAIVWTSGDGTAGACLASQEGPLRCGIFAKSTTTTRMLSGMSFYGAMDLSGNVAEYYVCAYAGSSNASQASSNSGLDLGDGMLDAGTGNSNIINWPDPVNPTPSSINNIILRGGSFHSSGSGAGDDQTNVSYRNMTYSSSINTYTLTTITPPSVSGTGLTGLGSRRPETGGRGGR